MKPPFLVRLQTPSVPKCSVPFLTNSCEKSTDAPPSVVLLHPAFCASCVLVSLVISQPNMCFIHDTKLCYINTDHLKVSCYWANLVHKKGDMQTYSGAARFKETSRKSGRVGALRLLNNEHKRDTIEWVCNQHGQQFVDLGCGRGGDHVKWSKSLKNNQSLLGVDITEDAIKEAQRRADECAIETQCKIEYVVGNCTELKTGPINGLTSLFSLNYMPNVETWLPRLDCAPGCLAAFVFTDKDATMNLLQGQEEWVERGSRQEIMKVELVDSQRFHFQIVTEEGNILVNDSEFAISCHDLTCTLKNLGWSIVSITTHCCGPDQDGWPLASVYRTVRAVYTPVCDTPLPFSFDCLQLAEVAAKQVRSEALNMVYGQSIDHPLWRQKVLPAPQPTSMRSAHRWLVQSEPNNWWVSAKSDGVRSVIMVKHGVVYVFDRSFEPWVIPYFKLSCDSPFTEDASFMIDAEWMDNRFVAHDAVCVQQRVATYAYSVRMRALAVACDRIKFPWPMTVKKVVILREAHVDWQDCTLKEGVDMPNDGVIFIREDAPFLPSLAPQKTDVPSLLKLKNRHHSTVDFLVVPTTKSWLSSEWVDLMLLHNDTRCVVDTIKLVNSDNSLLPCVAEMRMVSCGDYVFIRWRPDRDRPNTLVTALNSI